MKFRHAICKLPLYFLTFRMSTGIDFKFHRWRHGKCRARASIDMLDYARQFVIGLMEFFISLLQFLKDLICGAVRLQSVQYIFLCFS